MSGIIGTYYLDGRPVEPTIITKMVDKLAHRGPDGADIWISGNVGLGHRMLWTTPESLTEKLPLQQGALTITADARIDNRDELIAALGLENPASNPLADSEIILAAYEKWGEDCPDKLLGDFAFVIWDHRNQILFCARDYFGVRPFFYHYSPQRLFVFGSEIKALFSVPEVPRRLNEFRVLDYLEMDIEDQSITFYQGVFRLPPAHTLTISLTDIRLKRYWSLNPHIELQLSSEQEYAEAYLDVFSKAVHCRLRSAFPIGSALSGGLDSSSIICIAKEFLKQQGKPHLRTFSAIFDEVPESDERPYINAVLAQGDLIPHYIHADQVSPLVDLENVLWHQDEPFFVPNLFIHWELYKAAQAQGVRVFLDGYLGDNIVGYGWEYLIELAQSGQWLSLFKELKASEKNYPGYSSLKMTGDYIWAHSVKPAIPRRFKDIVKRLRFRRPQLATTAPTATLISDEFVQRIRQQAQCQPANTTIPHALSKPISVVKQDYYQTMTSGEIPLGLEIADKIASAFSTEARFPFTDRRLAELCLAIPASQRIHDGFSRMIVRRALRHHLPDKVCWRAGKGNLSQNFDHSLLTFEQQRLQDIFFKNAQVIAPFINIAQLQQQYSDFVAQQGTEGSIPDVWTASTLALWLNQIQFERAKEVITTGI